MALHPKASGGVLFLGVQVTSASSYHTFPAPATITPEILGPRRGFSLPPHRPSPTLAAVVVGVGAPRRRRKWIGGWARAQGSDHLHDIGHDHLAGTHGLEPLGRDAIRVIFNVKVRFDGHWPPAACGVDGDLFKLGAGGTKGQSWGPGYQVVDARASSLNRHCDALIQAPSAPIPITLCYNRGIGDFYFFGEKGRLRLGKSSGCAAGPKACTHGMATACRHRQLPALTAWSFLQSSFAPR